LREGLGRDTGSGLSHRLLRILLCSPSLYAVRRRPVPVCQPCSSDAVATLPNIRCAAVLPERPPPLLTIACDLQAAFAMLWNRFIEHSTLTVCLSRVFFVPFQMSPRVALACVIRPPCAKIANARTKSLKPGSVFRLGIGCQNTIILPFPGAALGGLNTTWSAVG
jgi:hypothetical protein